MNLIHDVGNSPTLRLYYICVFLDVVWHYSRVTERVCYFRTEGLFRILVYPPINEIDLKDQHKNGNTYRP